MSEGGVLMALLPGIGTALAGAIAALWWDLRKRSDEAIKRANEKWDECEEQHSETKAKVVDLSERIGRVEGRQEGIEYIAERVLKEIRDLKNDAAG